MRIFFSGIIIMILASCSSQKINIGAVKTFAGSTKNISTNTAAVYENMWQLKHDIVQLSIATIDSPAYLIESLNENYQQKLESENNAATYESLYGVLNDYATIMLSLTNEEDFKNLKKGVADLQCSMDLATKKYNEFCRRPLPLSLGSFVSKIAITIGDFRLKKMQKLFLKESIDSGYEAVMEICDNYSQLFAPRIKKDIDRLPNDINNAYTGFLETLKTAKNSTTNQPYLFYTQYNPIYLDMIRRHQLINQVYEQNMAAIQNIRKGMIRLKESYLLQLTNKDWVEKNKDLVLSAHQLKNVCLNLLEKK